MKHLRHKNDKTRIKPTKKMQATLIVTTILLLTTAGTKELKIDQIQRKSARNTQKRLRRRARRGLSTTYRKVPSLTRFRATFQNKTSSISYEGKLLISSHLYDQESLPSTDQLRMTFRIIVYDNNEFGSSGSKFTIKVRTSNLNHNATRNSDGLLVFSVIGTMINFSHDSSIGPQYTYLFEIGFNSDGGVDLATSSVDLAKVAENGFFIKKVGELDPSALSEDEKEEEMLAAAPVANPKEDVHLVITGSENQRMAGLASLVGCLVLYFTVVSLMCYLVLEKSNFYFVDDKKLPLYGIVISWLTMLGALRLLWYYDYCVMFYLMFYPCSFYWVFKNKVELEITYFQIYVTSGVVGGASIIIVSSSYFFPQYYPFCTLLIFVGIFMDQIFTEDRKMAFSGLLMTFPLHLISYYCFYFPYNYWMFVVDPNIGYLYIGLFLVFVVVIFLNENLFLSQNWTDKVEKSLKAAEAEREKRKQAEKSERKRIRKQMKKKNLASVLKRVNTRGESIGGSLRSRLMGGKGNGLLGVLKMVKENAEEEKGLVLNSIQEADGEGSVIKDE